MSLPARQTAGQYTIAHHISNSYIIETAKGKSIWARLGYERKAEIIRTPRSPLPKGFHAFFGSLLKGSSSMRSGLNSCASSPYTDGSTCIFLRSNAMGSPLCTGYFPARRVSSFAVTANCEMGESNLSVSRSTYNEVSQCMILLANVLTALI